MPKLDNMIKVKLKNGSERLVPEITAKQLVSKHGASIIGEAHPMAGVPVELQKTPLITELPQFAKQVEILRAENDKLIAINKKQAQDIVELMQQIEKLKENGKTIQADAKETKSGKKAVDPNS